MRKFILPLAVLAVFLSGSLAFAQEPQEPLVPPEFADRIPLLSGMPSLMAAQSLGIDMMMGKELDFSGGPPGNAKAKKLKDVPIGADPNKRENEPTVAANPKDKKKMVAGSHWFRDPVTGSNRCVAYYSEDGGKTWSDPIPMPHLPANPGNNCSDPVLAYAPDGSRVYYAYMDLKAGGDFDIVVSYSDDDGETWTGPIIALNAIAGQFLYDKCWIGTHVDEDESNWVYVTATQFDMTFPFEDFIAFARSDDQGQTWDAPTLLGNAPGNTTVQGSRPTGGLGGDVLVAWYYSTDDGWLIGGFEINTAYSDDHGATFGTFQVAAADNYEAPFWLGPFAFYNRWWGTMFPDVEIDGGGTAHIVYTHDPVENAGFTSLTPEDGDIRYVYSAGPPYDTWSDPVTVNDDGMERAQGYAAMETQHGGKSATVHVIWDDTRLSPDLPIAFPESPNLYFDMFYSRHVPGKGVGWFKNFRVTEESSIQDFIFKGDYNDLTANSTTLFGIFTDRRDKESIFDFEDDVFGSLIIAGGGTSK